MEEAKNLLLQIMQNSKNETFVYFNIAGSKNHTEVIKIKVKNIEHANTIKNDFWSEFIKCGTEIFKTYQH